MKTLITDNCQILIPKIGDYVHAAKFPDYDPHDPWRIGFVVKITETRHGFGYVIGEQDGSWSDQREYKHVKRISAEEGRAFLSANAD